MSIHYSPRQNKISMYTPNPLSYAFSVASVNYVSTLNSPCRYPQVIPLTFYGPNTHHTTIQDIPYCVNVKIGYCSRHNNVIIYKNSMHIILFTDACCVIV